MARRSIVPWLAFTALWTLLLWFSTTVAGMACTAGHGSTPQVEPGSTLARFCEVTRASDGIGVFQQATWLVAPVMVALAGILALRTGRRRVAQILGALLVLACVLHGFLALALPAH